MLDFAQFEAVTFDCCGRLDDWEAGILAQLRPVLNAHGVVVSDDELLDRHGAVEAAEETGEPISDFATFCAAS